MAQKRKRNKKWIYVMLAVVLVASAGVTCWLLRGTKSDRKEGGQTETTLQREDNIDEEEVERPSEEVAKVDPGTGKEIVVQYDGEDPNQADDPDFIQIKDDLKSVLLHTAADSPEREALLSAYQRMLHLPTHPEVDPPEKSQKDGDDFDEILRIFK